LWQGEKSKSDALSFCRLSKKIYRFWTFDYQKKSFQTDFVKKKKKSKRLKSKNLL